MNSADKKIILDSSRPMHHLLELAEEIKLGKNPCDRGAASPITTGKIWFRGEPEKYETYLTPKLYRYPYHCYEEDKIIIEFMQMADPRDRINIQKGSELLGLMQHYEVPTRLLDWTTDIRVALYFAIGENEQQFEKNGVIYMYPIRDRFVRNGKTIPITEFVEYFVDLYSNLAITSTFQEIYKSLRKETFGYNLEIEQLDGVINRLNLLGRTENFLSIIFPQMIEVFARHSHIRIDRQKGAFTINFGKYINGKEILSASIDNDASGFNNSYYEIIVSREVKLELIEYLRSEGITRAFLFPMVKNNFYQDMWPKILKKL